MPVISLRQLQLTNFRSYRELTWHCQPGLNIIQGPNAAGKTNLLEAVGYLSFARSLRQQQDQQVVSWGENSFQVKGFCNASQENLELAIIYQQNHKELTINGQQHRLVDLLGILPVIYFGPDDLLLLKGAPVYRRQFLDREISILDRLYCHSLQSYRRLLLQRNRLLREIKAGRGKGQDLEPWNIQLVSTGLAIIQRRRAFLQALEPLAAAIYQSMDAREQLTLTYRPSVSDGEEWLAKINAGQEREIQAGLSLWGPHRDDFSFFIGDYEARFFASQGQQRSAVLALKIAEARIFMQVLGKRPILLLDDVFSELDSKRQQALLELLATAGQTFLTTTELTRLPASLLEQATLWQLSGERRLVTG
ncbi:DNA-binding, RecF [Moorella glycerini]|uniref:DNA replication and repair protein RecF n=1 Tax=Neomoorella stamsii TaxID=1266720 RepID=A0A9X7P6H3_9FIRM|nr:MULTISPECIES: DNA replication/repair protein RecF [Moorella]PRR73101.1 DNA replication and repair protein RecF [Moorella stamsii]CEP67739.1 DNA-binding, RecF [Moorella glycerini]